MSARRDAESYEPDGPTSARDVSSWQSMMRSVVLDTIGPEDLAKVLMALLKSAQAGDLGAARLILAYAVGSPARKDEDPRGTPGPPTTARAGSKEKLNALAYRRAQGLPLHVRGDGGDIDLS